MNKLQIFSIWAPDESPWSRWAKPVLFAHVEAKVPSTMPAVAVPEMDGLPTAAEQVALVIDLPGASGVELGLALADRGYRPVPLYNAVPLPAGEPEVDPVTARSVAAVTVWPIVSALRSGTERLAGTRLPADAPPAFLLDSGRQGGGWTPAGDEFDNRSICFTTDFPSGNFLAAHGIQRVILVQESRLEPLADLAQVLRRWQEAGIRLQRLRLDSPAPAEDFTVPRPRWFGWMFQRVLAGLGLRRADGGGYGDWVPDSASGG